jgi:hypothetical protein
VVLSGQLRCPGALNPGKMSQYPRGRRLGGPQIRSRAIWRRENPLALPIVQHATYSLYRLSYLGSFYLPNNVTFFEEYMLKSPSLELLKQNCSFLPISNAETFLAAARCQTPQYKTASDSEA